ncbi:hypothetical protein MNBD_ALPHA06-59 [hydrothermal vent metagenome]|uniref:J domain-containing protein n=1 Tax=hydrothermal vent metagenome TaxID=652676 RepID=A0A3B0RV46_9ZZZZ
MNDSYQILGLSPGAPKPAIRKAWRNLAKTTHPDRAGGNAEQFSQIQQAYKTLIEQPEPIDDTPRPRHNREHFLKVLGRKRKPRPKPGKDISTNLEISVADLFKDSNRRITLANGKALEISIPKGHDPAQILRLPNMGKAGINGGAAGDMRVQLQMKPERGMTIKGRDIHTELCLKLTDLRRGGVQRFLAPSGRLEVNIPVLAEPGQVLRLAGKGLPARDGRAAGDLFIRLDVEASSSFTRSVDQFAR